jgi:GTP-binding protein of the ras superfamily involved in termination of M-phase
LWAPVGPYFLLAVQLLAKSSYSQRPYCSLQTAIPFLIGTKFDTFATFPRDEQEEITKQAKRFARAMHASLIFCSTSASINVQKIFKIVLAKAFDLKCVIPEIEGIGEPILIYVDV